MNVITLESTVTKAKVTHENRANARNCEEGATLNTGWTVEGSNPGKGKRFYSSHNAHNGSGAHLDSYSMGNGVFSRQQSYPGVKVTSVLHLITGLRISGAIPLCSLQSFMVQRKKILLFPA